MKVLEILPESPLYGYVRKGDSLTAINGEAVEDRLDCNFKLTEERVLLEFESPDGTKSVYELENDYRTDIGLRFEKDRIKPCRNKCIFCFVHQQPKGMRRSLYLRDDDFRLSFTHGNFITLSNLAEKDIDRIIEQRLSPLYISVHTTDDKLRRYMFGNRNLPPILPSLKRLTDRGITIHTQVVVCPGINDNDHLKQTISDLHALFPKTASVGVVPVGLTKYRENLPRLRSFDSEGAGKTLDIIHDFQKRYLAGGESRFVFAADEFYIMSRRKIPGQKVYEEMPQFENGIGMMRLLLSDFNRRRRFLKPVSDKKKIAFVTGVMAGPIIEDKIAGWLRRERGYDIKTISVFNEFWGQGVTVCGLLTGRDILKAFKNIDKEFDILYLPPNCLNDDDLFLDDMPLTQFRKEFNARVIPGRYSMIDTLRESDA